MPSPERAPYERETLLFDNPEDAGRFRERVEQRTAQEQRPGTKRQREVVSEEVAAEFEKHGEAAGNLGQPWEHTETEHAEVQQLVEVVFSKDLKAALAQARKSKNYPRNVDLLHDVLTSEMYQLTQQQEINKQSVMGGLLVMLSIALIVATAVVLLFVASNVT